MSSMSERFIARNKKAYHDFEILEDFEAGLVLQGTEVKSLREHRVTLKESYARIKGGEVWLEGCHINPYSHGNISNHEPVRPRKLLLHKREIRRLLAKVMEKGWTLVPLSLYFSKGKVKVRIALARGKQSHDKREAKKRRMVDREIQAELKRRRQ